MKDPLTTAERIEGYRRLSDQISEMGIRIGRLEKRLDEMTMRRDEALAALAVSEASQRALRDALESTAIEASRAFGWVCVLCGTSSMRRELMVHKPDCLLAATSTAALGTGTTQRLGTVTGVDADGNTQIHTVMHAPDCDWSRCEGCGPQQREATS